MKTQIKILAAAVAMVVGSWQPSRAADQERIAGTEVVGTWRWNFIMPDGSTTRPKLMLRLEDGRLAGTTSYRPGTDAPITNAVLNGDELRFQVLRKRDDEEIVTTYSGKWTTNAIRGKIESNWAGEKQVFDWEAQRAKIGIEGIWRWTNSFFAGPGGGRGGRGGRGLETRVELEQEGEKVTGKTVSRFGPPTPIRNGSLTNGVVYFEIERAFGDAKFVTKFHGKQTGDTIKGTMELETGDDLREGEWEAKRVD
jgi:hypothetical protein